MCRICFIKRIYDYQHLFNTNSYLKKCLVYKSDVRQYETF